MNFDTLQRDRAKVWDALHITDADTVIAKKTCKIYFPERFLAKGMGYVGSDCAVVGVLGVVVDDYYAVLSVNAMIALEPDNVNRVKYQGVEYVELSFEAGSTVIKSLDLVMNDILIYKIYNELISKGNVPWYMGYDDMGSVFQTAQKHAGTSIANNDEVTEMIVSLIARSPTDKTVYYRDALNSGQAQKKYPQWIALMSAAYSATNTLNKIGGSYFQEGLLSAIVTPTERVEKIESMVRA